MRIVTLLNAALVFLVGPTTTPAPQHIAGRIVSVGPTSITLATAASRTASPVTRTIVVDPGITKVFKLQAGERGIQRVVGTLSDLRVGRQIVVTMKDQRATEISPFPPDAIQGRIVATDGQSLTIERTIRALWPLHVRQTFMLDPRHTHVSVRRVQTGPASRIGLSDLHRGQAVFVIALDDVAFVVNVQPGPPMMGIVKRISPESATLASAASLGQSRFADRTFAIGPGAEIYHDYSGEPPERAKVTDVAPGSPVALTLEDGIATAITIIHPSIQGRISEVGRGYIAVAPRERAAAIVPGRRFILDAHTKIYMGVQMGARRSAAGKMLRIFRYEPGGKMEQLEVGQLVALTAKGNLVLSMRVTPRTAGTRPATPPLN